MCSKLYAILIVGFINYSRVNGDPTLIDFEQCAKNLSTSEYHYDPYPIEEIENQNEIYLTFLVKAERDAHVIFSSGKKPAKKNDKAYEIVLGAEENHVSYIRTHRYTENVEKNEEQDIVSNDEWRQFWIRINPEGLIEVGKGKEESAFMSWKDDYRMPIDHYGFASYNNEISWSLQCPEEEYNPKTTEMIEENLKEYLLTNYNTSAPPRNNPTAFEQVNITIVGQHANIVNKFLRINGSVFVSWYDKRLSWKTSKYKLPDLNVEPELIWRPAISIQNNILVESAELDSDYITISHTGAISRILPLGVQIPSCESPLTFSKTHKLWCQTKVALTMSLEIIFEAYDDLYFKEQSLQILDRNKDSNIKEPDLHFTLIYNFQR